MSDPDPLGERARQLEELDDALDAVEGPPPVGELELDTGRDTILDADPGPESETAGLVDRNGQPFTPAETPQEDPAELDAVSVVTFGAFAAVDEPGAAGLLGSNDDALITENGDVMVYGDGGAGKTTLVTDLAFHLAAGRDWIGIDVPRQVRVLVIENEGPRGGFRRKLRRKLAAWGSEPAGLFVIEAPWAQFSFASPAWRDRVARAVADEKVDVLVAGPLTRVGMNEAGTLQEVRAFMDLVADLRARTGRPLTVIIVHHENKAGAISGAWEGASDTILHVQAAGPGRTVVYVQKSRWSSEHHHQTLKLAWAAGEGFELEVERDRDYAAEIAELLSDGTPRTTRRISAKDGGIAANRERVEDVLVGDPDRFVMVTGDAARALGSPSNAKLWMLARLSGATRASRASGAPGEQGVLAGSAPYVVGAEARASEDSYRPPALAPDPEPAPGSSEPNQTSETTPAEGSTP